MGGLVSGVGDLFSSGPVKSFGSSVATDFGANPNANSANTVAQGAPLIQPVTQGQVNTGLNATTSGIAQNQGLVNTLNPGVNQGVDTQSALTQALIAQANGQGANPSQAALNQNTGQNIAQQTAAAAGQRGASSNVGLIARQVGQQGAGIQQNAIGQEATLEAQQRLAAQQQLQQLAASQIGQGTNAIGNLNTANLGNQGQLLGALQGYNAANVSNTASQNTANAGIAETNANNTAKVYNNLMNTIGIKSAAEGGQADKLPSPDGKSILAKALSKKTLPDHMRAIGEIYHPKVMKMADGGDIPQPIPNAADDSKSSDSESQLEQLAPLIAIMGANKGAVVPGDPKVPGKNTLKNDVVPAMLTPKEIILPLSVTQAKNPGEAAKAFVEHIKGKDSESSMKHSDFKEALKKHVANRKSKKA